MFEVTLPKDILLPALAIASKCMPAKHSVFILVTSGILFQFDDGNLSISSTDAKSSVSLTFKAAFNGAHEAVVMSRSLASLENLMRGADIALRFSDKDSLNISSGKAKMRAQTQPAESWPKIEMSAQAVDVSHLSCQREDLLGALAAAIPAASTNDARLMLNGVCIASTGRRGLIDIVATDGKRLHWAPMKCLHADGPEKFEIILEKRAAEQLVSLLPAMGESLEIKIGNRAIFIDSKNDKASTQMRFASLGIDYNYIEWNELGAAFKNPITIDSRDLLRLLSRVKVSDPAAPVSIEVKGDILTATCASREEEASDEIRCEKGDEDNEIKPILLEARNLTDAIKACASSRIRIMTAGDKDTSPISLSPMPADSPYVTAIVARRLR